MKRSITMTLMFIGSLTALSSNAAGGITGWIIIVAQEAPAPPLRVGVDEGGGSGFGFVTLTDDNGDGMIELPFVPVGSRLALGVNHTGDEVGCDIWDFLGSDVQGGARITVPLLIVAEDIEGEALGIDFGELMAPPVTLTPGDRFNVTNGMLSAWPGIRLVNESGVPDLETFVQVVDTLPGFNGDVIVSNTTVLFTFVPEPSTMLLMMIGAIACLWSRKPHRQWLVLLGGVVHGSILLAIPLLLATRASGFALIAASGSGPADLINQPDNFYSFDGDVITWKMSSDFLSTFSDPVLKNQVRLAFKEWQTTATSATRRSATRWAWTRNNGSQPTIDLQSLLNQEIGHALGLQHPDASFFNPNSNTGVAWQRNYRFDSGGDLFSTAPVGGEIMNEGNDVGFLPDQKPPPGLNGGEYWRTTSRDEVAALDYAYGRPLAFQEVGPNDDAMITIETFQGGGGNNLGVGGIDTSMARDPDNPAAGRRILTSSVGISNNASLPMGVIPRSSSWSFTNNTGEALVAIRVRTEGTSTRTPLSVFSSGGNFFSTYEEANTVLLHEFENRGHNFSNPSGGSIPSTGGVNFGLELDVWDWNVERATAQTTGGEAIPLSMIALMGWNNGGVSPAPSPAEAVSSSPIDADAFEELITVAANGVRITAQGFRIVASDAPATLTELAFAPVAGRGLGLKDLTPETLAELDQLGDLIRLPIDRIDLEPHEDLVIVLDGLVDDLPAELREAGSFLLVNDARWADAIAQGEVFVYGRTMGEAGQVSAFSLLNSAAIVGLRIPEPGTLLLGILACATVYNRRHCGFHPRRHRIRRNYDDAWPRDGARFCCQPNLDVASQR